MSDDIAISVQDVSKAYRIWNSPAARLTSPLQASLADSLPSHSGPAQWLKKRVQASYRDFYALRDVSFTVKRGESLGVIGRNGSGKSTLLQIIAGTLQPTTGSVKVRGRVAALLELGSGFNPEFTGRENVYLNGAVLGLARTEIDARFESIATFADIGDFIDQPVKTYSSGMMIRLAFAVAVSVEPEILIVDEALSVGDVFFQQKCFQRVHEMLRNGVSLLFVSHDPAAIQNLCDHAVLLDQGKAVYHGLPEECASRYFARHVAGAGQAAVATSSPTPLAIQSAQLLAHNLVPKARARHGTRELEIIAVCVRTPGGSFTRQADLMTPLCFEVLVRAHVAIAQPSCGLHFFDRMNTLVYGAGNVQLGVKFAPLAAGAVVRLVFTVTMSAQPGPYTFNVAAGEPDPTNPNLGLFYDVCEGLGPLEILPPVAGAWPFYGVANLPMKMEIIHE